VTGRATAVFFTLALVMVAALSTSCRSRPDAAADDLDRVVAAGTVRVCSTGDYQPFTYRDPQGQWSGMDIDLAGDLAHRLGVKLQLVPTTWAAMVNDLGGHCDLAMGGITITLDRARKALYSTPYLRDGKAAIVRCADAAKYQSLADIDQGGVRVIVNPDGTNSDFDKANLHHATIVGYPDNNTIFEQIITGKADAMITDSTEIRWQTARNSALCGVDVDHQFNFAQKAYLIPRSGTTVQQWVNQWLNIIDNDGSYAAISQKWLGRVVGP
jgi:cyclohexadienyl dehydratase